VSVDVPDRLRLPIPVDLEALRRDVAGLRDDDWVAHFNTSYYTGDWSGVPLRIVGGRADRLFPDPMLDEPASDTPVLARCPAVRELLAGVPSPTTSVRFLRLGPGAAVREHRDHRLGYEDGEVRLHVPVTTGPDNDFLLNGTRIDMVAGECWYVNVNEPHAVANRGTVPRVHLVLDCVVDEWLDQTIGAAL
jgi:Aspartyl/Asparaginyl beta-hydroxylase